MCYRESWRRPRARSNYVLSGSRAGCGRKICALGGCDLSLDSQPMPNWLAVPLRTIARPVLAAAANSCWLVCNSFAHAARTKRLTFACRPPFVRSSDRESFGMRRSLGSRDTGTTGSESKPSVQEKKSKVFFTPYAPAVLTPRRSNRSQNGSYRDAATIVPQVRPLGFDSN
jgi:hypothetical protein